MCRLSLNLAELTSSHRAKIAVREARSEVTMLEKEAREEAKLADQHMRDAK